MKARKFLAILCTITLLVMNFSSCVPGIAELTDGAATVEEFQNVEEVNTEQPAAAEEGDPVVQADPPAAPPAEGDPVVQADPPAAAAEGEQPAAPAAEGDPAVEEPAAPQDLSNPPAEEGQGADVVSGEGSSENDGQKDVVPEAEDANKQAEGEIQEESKDDTAEAGDTDKEQTEVGEDKKEETEVGNETGTETPEDVKPEEEKSEEGKSEEEKTEEKTEEKSEENSEEEKTEEKSEENSEEEKTEEKSEDEKSEEGKSEDEKSEDEKSEDEKSEDEKSEDENSEEENSEEETPEEEATEEETTEEEATEEETTEEETAEEEALEELTLTDFAADVDFAANKVFPGDTIHFTFATTGAERVAFAIYNVDGAVVAEGEPVEGAFEWTASEPGAYAAAVTAFQGEELALTAELPLTVSTDYSAVNVTWTARYDLQGEMTAIPEYIDLPLEKGEYVPAQIDGFDYIDTLLGETKLDSLVYSEADRAWIYTAGEETALLTADAALTVRYDQQFTKRIYQYENNYIKAVIRVRRPSDVPDDAEFRVTPLTAGTDGYNYDAYMDALNQKPGDQEYTAENTLLYDFAFMVHEIDPETGLPTENVYEYQPESGNIRIEVTFKRNQISDGLNAEAPADVEVIHMPLDSDVREAVDSTAEATNISADDIQIDELNAKVNLDGSTDKVEFKVDGLSVVAVANVAIPAQEEQFVAPVYTIKLVDGNTQQRPESINITDHLFVRASFEYKDGNNTKKTYYNVCKLASLSAADGTMSLADFVNKESQHFGDVTNRVEQNITVNFDVIKATYDLSNGPAQADQGVEIVSRGTQIDKYTMESVTEAENTVTVTLMPLPKFTVKTELANGAIAPTGNFYVLAKFSTGAGERYALTPAVSFPSDNAGSLELFTDKDKNNAVYFTGNETVTLKLLKAEGDSLSLKNAVEGTNCVSYSAGMVINTVEDGTNAVYNSEVSYTVGTTEGTVKLTKLPELTSIYHKETVNLYGYNYTSKQVKAPEASEKLTGHYYMVATLAKNGTTTPIAYAIKTVDISALNEDGTTTVEFPANESFKLIDSDGKELGGTVVYNPSYYTISVRMRHNDSAEPTTYAATKNDSDTVPNYDFMPKNDIQNVLNGETLVGTTHLIELHSFYQKSYSVVLNYWDGNSGDTTTEIAEDAGYYLQTIVQHETTGTDYFLTPIAKGAADTEQAYPILPWSPDANGDPATNNNTAWTYSKYNNANEKQNKLSGITGNENITVRIIKKKDGQTIDNANPDPNKYTIIAEGNLVGGHCVHYGADSTHSQVRTVEDTEQKSTTITDFVNLNKVNVTDDYSLDGLLNGAKNFGIVADTMHHDNDLQTNFAVNHYYTSGHGFNPNLSGVNEDDPGLVIASRIEGGQMHVADGLANTVIVYTSTEITPDNFEGYDASTGKHKTGVTVVRDEYATLKGKVDTILNAEVNGASSVSGVLATKPATFTPALPLTGDQLVIDTTSLGDGTIYINASDIPSRFLTQGQLKINKNDGQIIVFNFTGNAHIGKFAVNDVWTDPKSGRNESQNDNLRKIAKEIVWNVPNGNATLDTMAGIVLVGGNVTVDKTSTGWVVCGGTFTNNAEWHNVYEYLPHEGDIPTSLKIEATKTLDGVENVPVQFKFKLERYDTIGGANKWVLSSGGTAGVLNTGTNGTVVEFTEIDNLSLGWNVFRISEYDYENDNQRPNYLLSKAVYYAAVKVTEGNHTRTVDGPYYYKAFTVSSFNRSAADTSEFLSDPLDARTKPVFDNKATGHLVITKTVEPAAGETIDTSKEFTFTITLTLPQNELTELGTDTTVTYSDVEFTKTGDKWVGSIKLKHGGSKQIDVPARTGYTVVESSETGYTTTIKVGGVDANEATGTIDKGEIETVAYTNTTTTTETGSIKVTKATLKNGVADTAAAGQKIKVGVFESESATTPVKTAEITLGSNGAGEVTFEGLKAGTTYYVYEMSGDTKIAGTKPTVTIASNTYSVAVSPASATADATNVPTVAITNSRTEVGQLTVTKTVGVDGAPVLATDQNADTYIINREFKVKITRTDITPTQYLKAYDETTKTPTFTENSNDQAKFTVKIGQNLVLENMPTGTYTVQEDTNDRAITGYTVNATNGKTYETVTLGATGSAGLVNNYNKITDVAHTGSFTITKEDGADHAKLGGAQFTLYAEQSCTTAITTITTSRKDDNTKGTAVLDTTVGDWFEAPYVPTATNPTVTLYLKETTAPEGYVADSTDSIELTITAGTSTSGWNDDHSKWVTTTNYIIKADNDTSKTVTNTKKSEDYTPVELELLKVDKDDSNKPIDGVTFTLTNSDTAWSGVSGETANGGKLKLTIPKDKLGAHSGADDTTTTKTFTLTETVPEGYVAAGPWTVTVKADGTQVNGSVTTYKWKLESVGNLSATNGVYTIENTRKTKEVNSGEAQLIKVDKNATTTALEGVQFTLYTDANDTTTALKTYTTGADGKFKITVNDDGVMDNLPNDSTAKTLYLKETAPKNGYKANNTAYTVTIRKGTPSAAVLNGGFWVTTTPYTIAITGTELEGSGTASAPYMIKNEEDTDTSYTYGKAYVKKTGQGTNSAFLPGAKFELGEKNGTNWTKIKEYTSSVTDGTFYIDTQDSDLSAYLPSTDATPKSLVLKETEAPDGYVLSATEYTVTITRETGTKQLENNKYVTPVSFSVKINNTEYATLDAAMTISNTQTSVKVSKVDATDNSKELEGAHIQIIKVDASTGAETVVKEWDSTTTAHVVTGLETGVDYILRETVAPANYKLTSDTTFSINADGTVNKGTAKTKDVSGETVLLVEDDLAKQPEFEKKVKDTNDTTGETSDWQDVADHDIGDAVPFKLTATLADNVTDYYQYHITFTDAMDESLDFNEDSVKVTVDGKTTSNYTLTPSADKHGFTLNLTWKGAQDSTGKFTGRITENLNGKDVVVEFTATLNEKAKLGSEGNVNKAKLAYSNNPKLDANGKPQDENNDNDKDNEKETDWDSVIVFTYKVEVDKVDANNEPLPGAQFKLEKKVGGKYVDVKTVNTVSGNAFTFTGLDDGDYKLTETVVPKGYKAIDPITFTVTANHEITWNSKEGEGRENVLKTLTGKVETGEITLTADNDKSTLTGDVVNEEAEKPEFEKKVKDTNDSDGKGYSDWQDVADHDIGDAVPFKLTATLADNVTDYYQYHITFTDEMEKGLTLNADSINVKVVKGDTVITGYALDKTDSDHGFTRKLTWKGTEENGKFTKKIANADLNGANVIVEFTATLNNDAVLGSQGNVNKAKLAYSHNPNLDANGRPQDENDENNEDNEKETDWDSVIVFTYKVEVDKVDETGAPLPGAQFKLEKKVGGNYVDVKTVNTVSGNAFTFTGLDDGDYKLTETVVPEGYIGVDPIEFTVTAEHKENGLNGDASNRTDMYDEPAFSKGLTFNKVTGGAQADVVNTKYEADGTTTLKATKKIVGREFKAGDEWTFTVTADPKNAPMPEKTSITIKPTSGQSVTLDFGKIVYDVADLGTAKSANFTYTITETGSVKYVQNDTAKQVHVSVTDKGEGKLEVMQTETAEQLTFTNRYDSGSLAVKKVVSPAAAAKNAEFTFTVTLNDKTINGTYGDMTFTNGVATVKVKHDETKTAAGLPNGMGYTVKETEIPAHYRLLRDVNANGTIATNDTMTATFTNEYIYTAKVSKVDVTTEEELEGAHIQILDKDGNVVEEWDSTKDVHETKELKPGEEYTLRETVAPEGYTVTTDTKFTVNEDGTVTTTGHTTKDENGDEVLLVEDAKTSVKISKVDVDGGKELEGAKIQIKDSKGTVVAEWTSGKEAHEVTGLKTGETYTLHEEVAPEGYTIATDTTFTIDATGKVTTTGKQTEGGVLLIEDAKTSIKISKVDVTTQEELEGAHIQILDKDGKVVKEWDSKKAPEEIKGLKTGEEYTLRETVAPEGYTVTTDTKFSINEDGTVTTTGHTTKDENGDEVLLVEDAKTSVKISKVDVDGGKELEGAKIQIKDSKGTVVAEWTSGKTAHEVTGLKTGETYTLHEEVAPEGYTIATDTTFTIDATGKVTTTGKQTEGGVLLIEDAKTSIKISKVDVTTQEELEGAHIQILDKDGKVVKEWDSKKTPEEIKGLKTGEEYTLRETVAPEGYDITTDTKFSINTDGTVKRITGNITKDGIILVEDARKAPTTTVPATTETPAPTATATTAPTTAPTATPAPGPTTIAGKKTWVDANNYYYVRPESIKVTLLANGTPVEAEPTWTKDDWNTWSYSFGSQPSVTDAGIAINYTVKEEPVEFYNTTYDGFNITNTLIRQESKEFTDLKGTKTWNDSDNVAGKRPTSITVHLIRNGVEVASKTVTAEDGWTYSFENQPVDTGYGTQFEYEVREDDVPGYFSRSDGLNLTNTLLDTDKPGQPGEEDYIEGRKSATRAPKFKKMTEEELEELLELLDYGTPLWGMLGTGDETPAYPFVFGGIGALAVVAYILVQRKKRRNAA